MAKAIAPQPKSIYDSPAVTSKVSDLSENQKAAMVSIDINKRDFTLMDAITLTRTVLDNLSDDEPLTVYIVGFDMGSDFLNAFHYARRYYIAYLKELNREHIQFMFRGGGKIWNDYLTMTVDMISNATVFISKVETEIDVDYDRYFKKYIDTRQNIVIR